MSPPLLGISEGPGSLGTATCPTSLERVEGGSYFPLGGPRGWDNLCPAVIPQPGGSWKTQSHPVQAWTSVSAVDIPARLFLCSTTRCPMDSTWKCISR